MIVVYLKFWIQIKISSVKLHSAPLDCRQLYKCRKACKPVFMWLKLQVRLRLKSSSYTDRKLTDGERIVMDISGEVSKLQASYNTAIQRRDEAKKQLAQAISEQQLTKWELEHEKRRTKDYEKQTDRIRMEIAALKSHMPMISESLFLIFFFLLILCFVTFYQIHENWLNRQHIMFPFSLVTEEGCRHCLPGWTYTNSLCYYFAFSEAISRRPWQEARLFCTRRGGDLAVVDSREKHVRLDI